MKNIALLNNVKLKYIGEKLYINLESFICYLKSNHSSNDSVKVRSSNIIREFSLYNEGMLQFEEDEYVSFFNCLKFIFKHSSDYQICADNAAVIEEFLLRDNLSAIVQQTHLGLYEQIAEYSVKPDFLLRNTFATLDR